MSVWKKKSQENQHGNEMQCLLMGRREWSDYWFILNDADDYSRFFTQLERTLGRRRCSSLDAILLRQAWRNNLVGVAWLTIQWGTLFDHETWTSTTVSIWSGMQLGGLWLVVIIDHSDWRISDSNCWLVGSDWILFCLAISSLRFWGIFDHGW